ncbi:MAG: alginate export family protein [Rugosibacter sp.]|nr:alginate export family protein [Rugosibacter sp.]
MTHAPSFMRPAVSLARVTTSAAFLALAAPSFAAGSFTEALTGGKPSADIRFRYETVDQDNALKNADAATVRLRLGYETGEFNGFGAFVEAEHVTDLVDDYNSASNGKTTYSIIADPESTEINQAYLSYAGLPDTKLKYGRQRLILDNHRFIGNVGWRQNEQTFDAFTLVNKSLPATTITAGYIYNVNRVFGDETKIPTTTFANTGDARMKSPIFNVSYKGWSAGEIVGYGYLLEYTDAAFVGNSTQTYGLRFKGDRALADGMKLLYTAEYASQSDYANNPVSYDVDYGFLEAGIGIGAHTFKLGYELLGSNGAKSFQTPLATLHAFNGWADVFLATPATGLEDVYLSAATTLYGNKLEAVYHDYQADKGGANLGSEWNLSAARAIDKNYLVGIKYASYKADTAATVDTDKFWLWAEAKF